MMLTGILELLSGLLELLSGMPEGCSAREKQPSVRDRFVSIIASLTLKTLCLTCSFCDKITIFADCYDDTDHNTRLFRPADAVQPSDQSQVRQRYVLSRQPPVAVVYGGFWHGGGFFLELLFVFVEQHLVYSIRNCNIVCIPSVDSLTL